jgi:hypothetical protein
VTLFGLLLCVALGLFFGWLTLPEALRRKRSTPTIDVVNPWPPPPPVPPEAYPPNFGPYRTPGERPDLEARVRALEEQARAMASVVYPLSSRLCYRSDCAECNPRPDPPKLGKVMR